MRKFICALMACAMLMSLCACGGKTTQPSESPEIADEQVEAIKLRRTAILAHSICACNIN